MKLGTGTRSIHWVLQQVHITWLIAFHGVPLLGFMASAHWESAGLKAWGDVWNSERKKKKPCIHSDIKCRFRGVHFTSYQLNTRLLRPEDLPLYVGGPKAQAWENFFFQIGSHDLRSQNGNDATKSTKCWFLWSWGNNIWGKKPSSCFFSYK